MSEMTGFQMGSWMNEYIQDQAIRMLTNIPWDPEGSEYRYKSAKGDERYKRKLERIIETPVTAEEFAAYAEAEAAWAVLENSPYFEGGGSEYGPELRPPQPKRKYVYAETEDEWRERCRNIKANEEQP